MNTKVLLEIFTDEMHENKIMDVILKLWIHLETKNERFYRCYRKVLVWDTI